MDMYRKALIANITFITPQGVIGIAELFDLPLTSKTGRANLNDIAIDIHKRIQAAGDNVSFVETARPTTITNDELALEVVKDVIAYKQEKNAAAAASAEREAKRVRIRELIEMKKDAELTEKSAAELEELLKTM